jgi:hypothetical protein
MASTSPSSADLLAWLAEHPAALEPGLVFYEGALDLGAKLSVPLHGVDPLGRPCVVHAPGVVDTSAMEWMVEVVSRLRAEADRLTRWYTRAKEPRVFLVAPHFRRQDRDRLTLLADAFPLRAFSWEWPAEEGSAPSLLLEMPLSVKDSAKSLGDLPEELRRPGQRILRAADQVRPPLTKVGAPWPLLFIGSQGPCASLYKDGNDLVFASQKGGVPEVLEIVDDESADIAIDRLMREQWQSSR